jgi:cytochrome c peroxidase
VTFAARILAAALLCAAACAAAGAAWMHAGFPGEASAAAAVESPRVALGRSIFFDARLSEPRGTSCASCHEPARAYSGDHGSGVGVPAGSRPGVLARRTAPSLLYLRYVPRFRFFSDDSDNHAIDYAPHGGFFWDGRADSIAELVRQPLLNPREMNNRDAATIAEKLRHAPYADAFRREFPGALDGDETAVGALGVALQAFLLSPPMAPFASKYDDYIRGKVSLTAQEKRGLELFKDRTRVGCSVCHTLVDNVRDPERSLFTDFGFEAAGAPRNARVGTADEDTGVCERTDANNPSNDAQYCASFRTPSLRNVAVRKGFMHNGAFANLRDVVRFYATRGTNPERWYPSGVAFDGTPAAYRGQVNTTVVPYNRRPGDAPALDDGEIDAMVAFLRTLTDRTE